MPWLIVVPTAYPLSPGSHGLWEGLASKNSQAAGRQRPQEGRGLPLALPQPLPQAGPRTTTSDSGVCLDRDNELRPHFLWEL